MAAFISFMAVKSLLDLADIKMPRPSIAERAEIKVEFAVLRFKSPTFEG